MMKFSAFPGYLDILIILVLIVFAPKTITGFYVTGACASLRIILPMLITRTAMGISSSRQLTLSLIMTLVGLCYLMIGGDGWRAIVATYLGAAAASEIAGMFMLKALSNGRSS